MKRHLTEEEIAACVAGETAEGISHHLAECEHCGRQVTTLARALHGFRSSADAWAEWQRPAVRVPEAGGWWAGRPQLAIALFALATVASIPAYRQFAAGRSASAGQQATAQHDNESDAALLQEVNAKVSRSVPAPLEPLMTLMQGN